MPEPMTPPKNPIPGIRGDFHAGHATLEFDVEDAVLLAPNAGQYLPCEDCCRVFVVDEDVRGFSCVDCSNAAALTIEDLVEVLRELGPRLITELVSPMRERCGSHYLTRRRVRLLFHDAQERWPDAFETHRVENDPTDLYIVLKKDASCPTSK